MSRKNSNASYGPRIVPLQRISERVGVPIKPIMHLPEPDEPEIDHIVETNEMISGNGIRTKKGVWDGLSPGKLRASWAPRGGEQV